MATRKFSIGTPGGLRLAVHPSNLDTYIYASKGGVERNLLSACLKLLRPGDVFYDVGANIGYISGCVAMHFCNQVHVVAFEPQVDLAKRIDISMHINGVSNYRVLTTLLGDKNELRALYMASHSIWASVIPREKPRGVIWTEANTLDRAIEEQRLRRPTFVKIDVEGAELEVIRGAKNILSETRPTLIFESDQNAARFGYTRQDVINLLTDYGYNRFFFVSGAGALTELNYDEPAGDIVAIGRKWGLE